MRNLKTIVHKSLSAVEKAYKNAKPSVSGTNFYGDDKKIAGHFAVVVLYKTDEDLKAAQSAGQTEAVKQSILSEMLKRGYPEDAIRTISFRFISEQRVKEEANGVLFTYLK